MPALLPPELEPPAEPPEDEPAEPPEDVEAEPPPPEPLLPPCEEFEEPELPPEDGAPPEEEDDEESCLQPAMPSARLTANATLDQEPRRVCAGVVMMCRFRMNLTNARHRQALHALTAAGITFAGGDASERARRNVNCR